MLEQFMVRNAMASSLSNSTYLAMGPGENGSGSPRGEGEGDGGEPYIAGDDYDYYNIADRAANQLKQPYNIIAIVLGLVALTANILSIIAVFKIRKAWTSRFRLLVSLMASDLIVDISVIFYVINIITNPMSQPGDGPYGMRLKSRCAYMVIRALNTMGLNITLLNLMGMALDHYLAIIKPLHQGRLLNETRCSILIVGFWLVAFVTGFSNFISPVSSIGKFQQSNFNYCEYVWTTPYQEEYTMFAIALLCLCLMSFMYGRIYNEVHLRKQRLDLVRIKRSRQALLTTFLIMGSFMLCWLPTCLYQITLLIIATSYPEMIRSDNATFQRLMYADKFMYDLLLLNTLFDPLIYVIRIKEVKLGYQKLFRLQGAGTGTHGRGTSSWDRQHSTRSIYYRESSLRGTTTSVGSGGKGGGSLKSTHSAVGDQGVYLMNNVLDDTPLHEMTSATRLTNTEVRNVPRKDLS